MTAGFPCAAGLNFAEDAVRIAIACGAVAAAAILMLVLAMWARRRALGSPKAGLPPGQLTIEKLEELRSSGLISGEEFSSLRRAALGLKGPPDAKGGPGLTEGPRRDDEEKTDPPADGRAPRPGQGTSPPP